MNEKTLFPFAANVPVTIEEIGGEPVEAVRISAVHAFLEIAEPVDEWKNSEIRSLEFREEIDYAGCFFTADAAKNVCICAATRMGHVVRKYLIDIEEKVDSGGFFRFMQDQLQKEKLPKSDLPSPYWEEIVPPPSK